MTATALPPATSTAMLWTGRVLSALPVLLLLFSATMKLIQPEGMPEQFAKMGYPPRFLAPLGIVELISTVLYLVPPTRIWGAILLTGYLGGATATHLRLEEAFVAPVLVGVFLWLGLTLRDARLRALVFPGRK